MSLEILVFSLCVGDYACDEALKAYYYQKPHIKALKNKVKDDVEKIMGENFVYTFPAIVAATSGLSYQIKINREYSFGSKGNGDMMVWYRKYF